MTPATPGRAESHAVLIYEGEVAPFTRVLRGEQSDAAARYRASQFLMGTEWRKQWAGRPLLGKGLRIEVAAIVTVPVAKLWRQDADNLLKAILDSAKGVVFTDDVWISKKCVTKEPARPIIGVAPGVWLVITWGSADA